MSKFTAIVCDHCDLRDVIDSPVIPQNDIMSVSVAIIIDGVAGHSKAPPNINADLCGNCRMELYNLVMRLMSQRPRAENA